MSKRNLLVIPLIVAFCLAFQPIPAKALTIEELQSQIEQLMSQITQLQQQLQEMNQGEESGSWCYDFNNNVSYGSGKEDVEALQTALQKEGFFTRDITGTFDAYTASAVTKFQEKYTSDVLSSWGLKKGTGFAGKTTIAKLNMIYGCGDSQSETVTHSSDCQTLWWYDEGSNQYCQQKQFCGAYMYQGLHTFQTKGECETNLRLQGMATTTPPCGAYGDVDLDGDIDKEDASIISNYINGSIYLSEQRKEIADVNADKKINVVDSNIINQYVEGTINSFYVCQKIKNDNPKKLSSADKSAGVTPDQITLPDEYQVMLDYMRDKYPEAQEYINKMDYALRDAFADVRNGVVYSGKIEDTTAYSHFQGMAAVLESFKIVQKAGYSGDWNKFTEGCFTYSNITSPIYKVIDGVPVVVPGSKIFDRAQNQWYVWDEWGKSARLATPLEAEAYDRIRNQVTEAGDGYLNMISTAEMQIDTREEWIKTAEERIAIIQSGGPASEMWGDVEYLQNNIERWKSEIEEYENVIEENEDKLADELGEIPSDWRSNSDNSDDSDDGFPETPSQTGGTPTQEYLNFWNKVDPGLAAGTPTVDEETVKQYYEDYLDMVAYNSSLSASEYRETPQYEEFLEFWNIDPKAPTIGFKSQSGLVWDDTASLGFRWVEDLNWYAVVYPVPGVTDTWFSYGFWQENGQYWNNDAFWSLINDPDIFWKAINDLENETGLTFDPYDDNGLPLTPAHTGGTPTQEYKDFWNAVDPGGYYDSESGNSGDESGDGEYNPDDLTDEERDYGTDEYWSYTLRNIEENLAAISGAVIRLAEGIKEFLSR